MEMLQAGFVTIPFSGKSCSDEAAAGKTSGPLDLLR